MFNELNFFRYLIFSFLVTAKTLTKELSIESIQILCNVYITSSIRLEFGPKYETADVEILIILLNHKIVNHGVLHF